MEKTSLKFKIYNRNKLAAIIDYDKNKEYADCKFFSNTILCLPKNNLKWEDIERFLESRICSELNNISKLDFLKKYHGELVEDYIYLKFL